MQIKLQFIIISFLASLVFIPSAKAGNVHGVFRVVKGNVQVKSPNGKMSKARLGQKVFPKDTIITDKDSRAKIVMIDENVINVSPASEIVFDKYEYEPEKAKKDVLIDVIYGKVRSKVNQKYDGANNKFRVKTPSAVAGVRGTDFFTSFNKANNTSSVVTFEGEVSYGLPGPEGSIRNAVSVKAGQMASNIMGQAPQTPRALPKSQLASMDKGSDAEKSEQPSTPRLPAEDMKDPDKTNQNGDKEEAPKDEAARPANDDNKQVEKNDNTPNEEASTAKNEKDQSDKKTVRGPRSGGPGGGAFAGGTGGSDNPNSENATGSKPPAGSTSSSTGREPASINPGGFNTGGTMLVGDDLVGGGGMGSFPESNFITGDGITDFNAINTDATRNLTNTFNPCVGTCSDIIRDVIENGNTRLIIRINNQ